MGDIMKEKLIGTLVAIILIVTVLPATGRQNYENVDRNTTITEDHDWSMFHHDSQHTGYSTSTAPDTNNIRWIRSIGDNNNYCAESSPAVYDGKVYVGSPDGKVYCLDAEDGDELWSYTTGGMVFSSPAVYAGRVYIGSWDHTVYCLNAITGEKIWDFPTGDYVSSSPTVYNDKVYIGSYDGNVYCLDVYGNGDGTTTKHWEFQTGHRVSSSPAVYDGKIFIGSWNGNVYCLDAEYGTEIWSFPTCCYVGSSPAVCDGKVYIGSDDNNVYCLDAATGGKIWNFTTDVGGGGISSSPAVFDGKVYIGAYDYNIYCLDAADGHEIWSYMIGDYVSSSPAVADGKVFIGSQDDGGFDCLNAENGNHIWSYFYGINGDVLSSPAVAYGNAYITFTDGAGNGKVYCFGDLYQSPSEPTISGPTAGGPEIELNFSAVATDPEGNQIYYMLDWGDGNISDWLGPFDSNESITINHSWTNNREYEIRAKAKNVFNNESDWSEPHNISIAEQIEISNIKLGFVYLRTFFTNNSYAYIYLLETLGLSVVISDEGLPVEAAVTDAVNSVTFELIDLLWEDQINQEDDNSSDGFSTHFEIPSSLLQITVYAYDENGTMIDMDRLDYLVFIDLTSGEESQKIGQIGRMRHRVRERIRDRLLHH